MCDIDLPNFVWFSILLWWYSWICAFHTSRNKFLVLRRPINVSYLILLSYNVTFVYTRQRCRCEVFYPLDICIRCNKSHRSITGHPSIHVTALNGHLGIWYLPRLKSKDWSSLDIAAQNICLVKKRRNIQVCTCSSISRQI